MMTGVGKTKMVMLGNTKIVFWLDGSTAELANAKYHTRTGMRRRIKKGFRACYNL